jgi:hypothetical protein
MDDSSRNYLVGLAVAQVGFLSVEGPGNGTLPRVNSFGNGKV